MTICDECRLVAHRVIFTQRTILVAPGAKRTLSRSYEYAAYQEGRLHLR